MIEFTKEELELIRSDIDRDMTNNRFGDKEFYKKLRDKIQYMIDNYCEHETLVTNNPPGHGNDWINKYKKYEDEPKYRISYQEDLDKINKEIKNLYTVIENQQKSILEMQNNINNFFKVIE